MTTASGLMEIAIAITFAALALGQILCMARLAIGPTSGDRVLALDTMVINSLGLIVVLLIPLQMTAIRRRGSASRNQRDETPVTSIDPWVESARRMSADEPQDDQS